MTMMTCGHAANATRHTPDGSIPSCAICDCVEQAPAPDLTGRQARCGCGEVRPSDPDLAFFEFRGEGSWAAQNVCKTCRYAKKAHETENWARSNGKVCDSFQPHGAYEFDTFYCGCRGWD